ncbi:MAG: cointegrate resolution protein T, partial [Pseudomonadales bacterium]
SVIQTQQAQGLQERLIEANAQLKLLGAPLANSDGARST